MQKTVYALIELQEVDHRLDELRDERGDLPLIVDDLENKFKMKSEELKKKKKSLQDSKMRQRELELNLDEAKEKLNKFEEQLYQVKTNKEYDAITTQTEVVKQEVEASENELLLLDENISTLSESLSELEREVGEIDSELSENKVELEQKLRATADEENLLKHERKIILDNTDHAWIKTYEMVRDARNGQGIAKVVGNVCGGCHAFIPPQKIVEVKKMKKIYTCETCGRILVWQEIEK